MLYIFLEKILNVDTKLNMNELDFGSMKTSLALHLATSLPWNFILREKLNYKGYSFSIILINSRRKRFEWDSFIAKIGRLPLHYVEQLITLNFHVQWHSYYTKISVNIVGTKLH